MKANEAPEKIFLHPDIGWLKRRVNQDSVEYTRTDAFIEKACKWLQEEVVNDYEGLVWENLIDNFRNYMKGE